MGFWEPFPNDEKAVNGRIRSLFGVLRTFSQPAADRIDQWQKSIWGFENLFPTWPCYGEKHFGSLFGVLRTFSQPSDTGLHNIGKSIWGFENLFPTLRTRCNADLEVYLGFWEPFPNTLSPTDQPQWSLFGVLRTFSQHHDAVNSYAAKSIWGFENLFPTVLLFKSVSFEVYLGFWEPFPNRVVISIFCVWSLFGVLRTFSQLWWQVVTTPVKSIWGFENLFPTLCRFLFPLTEVYLGFWEPFPNDH